MSTADFRAGWLACRDAAARRCEQETRACDSGTLTTVANIARGLAKAIRALEPTAPSGTVTVDTGTGAYEAQVGVEPFANLRPDARIDPEGHISPAAKPEA